MNISTYKYQQLTKLIKLLDKLGVNIHAENLLIGVYSGYYVVARKDTAEADRISPHRLRDTKGYWNK